MSVLRRAYLSRGGHICPEEGLSVLRRAYLSRGGPICPEAGLSVLRRAYLSRGGHVCLETDISVLRRAYLSRGGPFCFEAGQLRADVFAECAPSSVTRSRQWSDGLDSLQANLRTTTSQKWEEVPRRARI